MNIVLIRTRKFFRNYITEKEVNRVSQRTKKHSHCTWRHSTQDIDNLFLSSTKLTCLDICFLMWKYIISNIKKTQNRSYLHFHLKNRPRSEKTSTETRVCFAGLMMVEWRASRNLQSLGLKFASWKTIHCLWSYWSFRMEELQVVDIFRCWVLIWCVIIVNVCFDRSFVLEFRGFLWYWWWKYFYEILYYII